jgi:outer membrane protein OmpA-like peptidoglycan-associated protein
VRPRSRCAEALFTACCLGFAALAAAEPASLKPSADEIVRRLSAKPTPAPGGVAFRGVRVEHDPTAPPAPPPSLDLAVTFEFGSARLTPDAEVLLDRLGTALANPQLRGRQFLLAGHTDAVGGDEVNQALSEKRAEAVRDYLVRRYHVDRALLETKGFGRSRLLDPANPTSEVNRRVQVTNLSAR